jgi:hypothetical protein
MGRVLVSSEEDSEFVPMSGWSPPVRKTVCSCPGLVKPKTITFVFAASLLITYL